MAPKPGVRGPDGVESGSRRYSRRVSAASASGVVPCCLAFSARAAATSGVNVMVIGFLLCRRSALPIRIIIVADRPRRARLSPYPRLRPLQHIRRPCRRRVEQIVVLAKRKRRHLVEQRLLARMDAARAGAAEAEDAVLHRPAEGLHPAPLV